MNKGEIFWGKRGTDAIHPIVYLDDVDEDFFLGAMLTTSLNYEDNILMEAEHFESKGSDGVEYEFQFNNTHLVSTRLNKKKEWSPFRKVGQLTVSGVEFIDSKIGHTNGKTWEEYLFP